MTVAELIHEVLAALRNQLYADRQPAEYFRDERHLKQAIARYGYACAQRGWEFDVPFILAEIMGVVQVVKRQQVTGYLPVYLQSAIDRHVGEHAEELNAHAKELRNVAAKGLGKLHITERPPILPSATETLALLYQDMQRQKRAKQKPKAKQAQQTLL